MGQRPTQRDENLTELPVDILPDLRLLGTPSPAAAYYTGQFVVQSWP
jgi:hypothetical protein